MNDPLHSYKMLTEGRSYACISEDIYIYIYIKQIVQIKEDNSNQRYFWKGKLQCPFEQFKGISSFFRTI